MGAGGAGVRGHMISALQAVAASEGFRWVVLEVVTTHRNPSDRGHWAWDSEVIWGNKTKNTIFAPAQTACRVALMGGVELGWINQTPAVKHPQSNARYQPHAINRARAINRLAIDAWTRPGRALRAPPITPRDYAARRGGKEVTDARARAASVAEYRRRRGTPASCNAPEARAKAGGWRVGDAGSFSGGVSTRGHGTPTSCNAPEARAKAGGWGVGNATRWESWWEK
ncbi:hypothetical protein GGX14DRAFT_409151 [Mycena pura]|uniref:Uncharacterized protein n=1 Tax=Mycena pura TaxID=153505 RepID=A0AAD6UNX2_9AGAR|nr:hypothetical protein GGX14DRAFT_409151 [Mycena pura]